MRIRAASHLSGPRTSRRRAFLRRASWARPFCFLSAVLRSSLAWASRPGAAGATLHPTPIGDRRAPRGARSRAVLATSQKLFRALAASGSCRRSLGMRWQRARARGSVGRDGDGKGASAGVASIRRAVRSSGLWRVRGARTSPGSRPGAHLVGLGSKSTRLRRRARRRSSTID